MGEILSISSGCDHCAFHVYYSEGMWIKTGGEFAGYTLFGQYLISNFQFRGFCS
jgi:hypothetical protein